MLPDPRESQAAFELVELARRLANVVRLAVVHEADYAAARLRARYDVDADGEPVLTGWLPWLTRRAGGDSDWWAPEDGEQVVLLAPSGDLPQAVALPAIHYADRAAPSDDPDRRLTVHGDGARMLYDRAAHLLRFTAMDGAALSYDAEAHRLSAALPAGASTSIVSPGGVAVQGDVAVTGAITATGHVSDADGSMDEMRQTYNGHGHPGLGRPPTQQMD